MSVWALLGVVLRENWNMDHVMVDGCEVEIDDVETAWTMSERDRWGKTGYERSSGHRADITPSALWFDRSSSYATPDKQRSGVGGGELTSAGCNHNAPGVISAVRCDRFADDPKLEGDVFAGWAATMCSCTGQPEKQITLNLDSGGSRRGMRDESDEAHSAGTMWYDDACLSCRNGNRWKRHRGRCATANLLLRN